MNHPSVHIAADVIAVENAQIRFIGHFIAYRFTDSRTERFVTHWVRRGSILFVFWKFRIDCGRLQQRNRIRVESGNITASRVRTIKRWVSNHWQGDQPSVLAPDPLNYYDIIYIIKNIGRLVFQFLRVSFILMYIILS